MLNIFLDLRQLSRSFLMFVCPLSEKFPVLALPIRAEDLLVP